MQKLTGSQEISKTPNELITNNNNVLSFQDGNTHQVDNVESQTSALTESMISEFNQQGGNILKRSLDSEEKSSLSAEELLQNIQSTLKNFSELSAGFVNEFKGNKLKSELNEKTAFELAQKEKGLLEEIERFKKSQEEYVGEKLNGVSNDQRKEPLFRALFAIGESLPRLMKAYQATAGSPEAKVNFVQLCKVEMRSALLNVGVTGDEFTKLKETVTNNLSAAHSKTISTVLDKKTDTFIDLLKAGIKEVKDESIAPEAATKLAQLYSILYSVRLPIAATAIYVLGQLEGKLLAFVAPQVVATLVTAIKAYMGATTVPALCFAVSMILCLAYKFALQAKERVRPVAEDIKLAQQKTELLNMIAAKA